MKRRSQHGFSSTVLAFIRLRKFLSNVNSKKIAYSSDVSLDKDKFDKD